MDKFGRVWTKKIESPKIAENYPNNYFITVFQYIMCKHAQKRSFMTNLMKRQIHPYDATFLFFILDHFWLQNKNQWKKLSRKTPPFYCFYVWVKNKQVWTKKIGIWRKSWKWQKVLEFFFKTFWPFDLFCQTKFWKKNWKKADKKKGRG